MLGRTKTKAMSHPFLQSRLDRSADCLNRSTHALSTKDMFEQIMKSLSHKYYGNQVTPNVQGATPALSKLNQMNKMVSSGRGCSQVSKGQHNQSMPEDFNQNRQLLKFLKLGQICEEGGTSAKAKHSLSKTINDCQFHIKGQDKPDQPMNRCLGSDNQVSRARNLSRPTTGKASHKYPIKHGKSSSGQIRTVDLGIKIPQRRLKQITYLRKTVQQLHSEAVTNLNVFFQKSDLPDDPSDPLATSGAHAIEEISRNVKAIQHSRVQVELVDENQDCSIPVSILRRLRKSKVTSHNYCSQGVKNSVKAYIRI